MWTFWPDISDASADTVKLNTKVLKISAVIGLLLNAILSFAAPYHSVNGKVDRVWYANYSTDVCIRVNNDWYYFMITEGENGFLKSMVLSAYAGKFNVHAGSSEGEQVSRCDGKTAYPLKIFRLLE